MADYLPEMIEPPTPAPDNISDVIRDVDSEELGSDVDDSDLIEQEDCENCQPSLIEKQKLNMDDIFGAPKVKKIKLNREELAEERKRVREAVKLQKQEEKERLKQEQILQKEKEKAESRAGRPKKQLSPEHLKKLQEARAKAQEQKKANKSISESLPPNKVKFAKSEKQDTGGNEAMFTKEDLIKSQYEAIQMYDSKRKKEKAEKKKKQQEEHMLAQSQQTIRRAIGHPDPNDIWSHALNGMFQ
jgi:HD-GYP domain-containing protein (c-di-GMP phosphodiesterase class II)